jgi:hypothetical protein
MIPRRPGRGRGFHVVAVSPGRAAETVRSFRSFTAETSVEGSGGYVAIERVDGTLRGREGTFVLLHQGTMKRGSDFKLMIAVVPDSGTGRLVGLTGTMVIVIKHGKHSYEFDYALPEAP